MLKIELILVSVRFVNKNIGGSPIGERVEAPQAPRGGVRCGDG